VGAEVPRDGPFPARVAIPVESELQPILARLAGVHPEPLGLEAHEVTRAQAELVKGGDAVQEQRCGYRVANALPTSPRRDELEVNAVDVGIHAHR
jgi:hypothetical protein